MKVSKNQLKEIVKECLIEILSEGIGSIAGRSDSTIAPRVTRESLASARNHVTYGQQKQQTRALSEAIKREAGGNPMMEAIFADTAKNSLPGMLSHGDGSSPSSLSQVEQINGTPEEIFGEETAGKWAHLAFAEPTPKK